MSKTKHTPTPWTHDDGLIFTENKHGYNSQYNSIAHIYDMYADDGTAQPNAEFILKAVNMHDELVRKIKLFIELQEEVLVFIDKEQFQTVKAFIDSSKELINQSEQ